MKYNSYIDLDAVKELVLYAENDRTTYFERIVPTVDSLHKKWNRGTYDHKRAITAWIHVAEFAGKKYHKEFGGGIRWYTVFPVPVRREAAKELADRYMDNVKAGDL